MAVAVVAQAQAAAPVAEERVVVPDLVPADPEEDRPAVLVAGQGSAPEAAAVMGAVARLPAILAVAPEEVVAAAVEVPAVPEAAAAVRDENIS